MYLKGFKMKYLLLNSKIVKKYYSFSLNCEHYYLFFMVKDTYKYFYDITKINDDIVERYNFNDFVSDVVEKNNFLMFEWYVNYYSGFKITKCDISMVIIYDNKRISEELKKMNYNVCFTNSKKILLRLNINVYKWMRDNNIKIKYFKKILWFRLFEYDDYERSKKYKKYKNIKNFLKILGFKAKKRYFKGYKKN